MSDLTEGWKEILIMCAIAFTVALVMMVLVGLFAEVIIYLFAIGQLLSKVRGPLLAQGSLLAQGRVIIQSMSCF